MNYVSMMSVKFYFYKKSGTLKNNLLCYDIHSSALLIAGLDILLAGVPT